MNRHLVLCFLLAATTAVAQEYPTRPVRIVVPLSPGGFADTPTRMLAPRLSEQMGKQFFVDNRPGAGGTIGWDFVAKQPPDGYTLAITGSTHLISSHLYKNLGYDAFKDFTHITMMASGPYVLVVNPKKVPVASVRELIAAAKAKPGAIDYASSGNGSSQHLVGALFNAMTGVQLNHVPYKGSGPAMADLLGGHVMLMMDSAASALGPIVDRRIKALAVTTARRAASPLDGIPPIADTLPGFDAAGWSGLAAPARTPLEIVARVNRDLQALLKDPEMIRQIEQRAAMPAPGSPIEFAEFIKKEIDTWGEVVRATGTKPGN